MSYSSKNLSNIKIGHYLTYVAIMKYLCYRGAVMSSMPNEIFN